LQGNSYDYFLFSYRLYRSSTMLLLLIPFLRILPWAEGISILIGITPNQRVHHSF
jgi:hypothetical protein